MVGLGLVGFGGIPASLSPPRKAQMPKYTPQDDEMDGAYGSAPVSPPDKAPADKAPEKSVDEENAEEAEILIAKDKLPPGTKEGDVCSFKVSKDAGDEFILSYVKDEEQGEPTNDNLNSTTESELSALDTQGAS
jgi:hypothetical protein